MLFLLSWREIFPYFPLIKKFCFQIFPHWSELLDWFHINDEGSQANWLPFEYTAFWLLLQMYCWIQDAVFQVPRASGVFVYLAEPSWAWLSYLTNKEGLLHLPTLLSLLKPSLPASSTDDTQSALYGYNPPWLWHFLLFLKTRLLSRMAAASCC